MGFSIAMWDYQRVSGGLGDWFKQNKEAHFRYVQVGLCEKNWERPKSTGLEHHFLFWNYNLGVPSGKLT
jgi:hypothetical protein